MTELFIVLGFTVLATSGLRHQVEFGILAACMLAFAWLIDMTFTPGLAAGTSTMAWTMPSRRRAWTPQTHPDDPLARLHLRRLRAGQSGEQVEVA